MKIKIGFKWYDIWIGVYYDRKNKVLYVCPLPMFCIEIREIMKTKLYCPTCKRKLKRKSKYASWLWCKRCDEFQHIDNALFKEQAKKKS